MFSYIELIGFTALNLLQYGFTVFNRTVCLSVDCLHNFCTLNRSYSVVYIIRLILQYLLAQICLIHHLLLLISFFFVDQWNGSSSSSNGLQQQNSSLIIMQFFFCTKSYPITAFSSIFWTFVISGVFLTLFFSFQTVITVFYGI